MATAANDPAAELDTRIRYGATLAGIPRIVDLPAEMMLRAGSASQNGKIRIKGVSVSVLDLRDRLLFTVRHQSDVRAARFSPDGRWLVTASGDSAHLWDALTGAPVGKALTHGLLVVSAKFSPDSRLVVTLAKDKIQEPTVKVWDAATGQTLLSLQHPDAVRCAEFSPDGTRIATGCDDGRVRFWATASGREVMPPLQHSKSVDSLSFSPDGTLLATACRDNSARLWSAVDGHSIAAFPHRGVVFCLAFSPDGQRLATGSQDRTARVWNTSTGQPVTPPLRYADVVGYVAFSEDGRLVGADLTDHTNRAWDVAGAQPPVPKIQHRDTVLCASFSPDGRWIVTGSDDHTARVWEAASGEPVTPPLEHGGIVRTAAFSPDGRRVVTSCDDGAANMGPGQRSAVHAIGPAAQRRRLHRGIQPRRTPSRHCKHGPKRTDLGCGHRGRDH